MLQASICDVDLLSRNGVLEAKTRSLFSISAHYLFKPFHEAFADSLLKMFYIYVVIHNSSDVF